MADKKVSKNVKWIIVSFALAVLTIKVVLKQSESVSMDDIADYIASANIVLLGLGVVASALFVFFEGVSICSILRKIGYKKKLRKGLFYSTADVYFSAITPSATGGQPASAFFMRRDGIPIGVTTATLILNMMMYTFSIIFLGFIALIISPGVFRNFSDVSEVLIIIGAVSLSLLGLVFLLLLKKEDVIFKPLTAFFVFLHKRNLIKNDNGIEKRLEKAKKDYKTCSELLSSTKGVFLSAFVWNVLQRASQMVVPMLVYAALGGDRHKLALVFSKQCLITIGYNYIPIPGGMGISDYLMVDGFSEMMGRELAFVVEMISRGMTFYVCVSLSGIITLIGYLLLRKRKGK